jgi:DNA-binding response OmpR family regulator
LLVHRILVVEDDPRTAGTIKLYLEHDGFNARVAADRLAALESCRATVPDLIVLDRMRRHLDGLEICRRLRFAHLEIDLDRSDVYKHGVAVPLTATEYKLLETLCRAPGRVFTRADPVARVFGSDYAGTERTVDVLIANLRRKIESNPTQPALIATVFGAGYKWMGERHED